MISEWATKEELAKECKINLEELERIIPKLIKEKKIEADESDSKNPKFKINQGLDIKRFLEGLEQKYGSFKNAKINIEEDKYFPIIRHGYLHIKSMFERKRKYPPEIIIMSKEEGYDLEATNGSTEILNDAELFELEPKTKWILQMTDNEVFTRNTPYKKFIIDTDLDLDGLWFKGFLITDKLTWTYWGETDGYCETPLLVEQFNDNLSNLEKSFIKNTPIKKSTMMKLKMFICNFIDFLNNPEVRIIRIERSQKNIERRKKQGKEVLPSSNKILITGELRQYLEKIQDKSIQGFNHRFWVRGHFKRFWNKKRYSKLYSLLENNKLPSKYYTDDKIRVNEIIIMIWNKPFIKGKGVLISNKYEVKKQ